MLPGRPVSGKKARALVERGALLFDTRDPVSFRNGTLPGAVNLQLRQVSSALLPHPKNTKVIFFGESSSDNTLLSAVNYALQYGYTEVFVMSSIDGWNK
jgi:rhodanese-related sulfurtransferase